MFPGKERRSPASMALQKVDIASENIVAWKNAIRAARCGSGHKTLAAGDSAVSDDEFIVVCGSAECDLFFTLSPSLYRALEVLMLLAIQSWLLAVRVPLRTRFPFSVMVQMFLLKYASQPLSHSCPTN